MKADLNEEIRRLKAEGKSLRAIATALGISHEAVRKRLRGPEGKDRVSTTEIPSLSPTTGVNPSGIASGKPSDCRKGVSPGVCFKIIKRDVILFPR